MGVIMTIILFAVIAFMNIWCSFMLVDVMNYKKTHVDLELAFNRLEVEIPA